MAEAKEKPSGQLKLEEARARLALVIFIQIVGSAIAIIPIRYGYKAPGWQHDCFWIAVVLCVLWVIVILMTCAAVFLLDVGAGFSEASIGIIFFLNTIALSLAMARTGGPSCSLFGHAIPLQLSGILLLEQQKEKMTGGGSHIPALVFGAITIVIWGLAVLFWQPIARAPIWSGTVTGTCADNGYSTLASSLLIAFGMVFTVITYFLPQSQWFIRFFVSKRDKQLSTGA